MLSAIAFMFFLVCAASQIEVPRAFAKETRFIESSFGAGQLALGSQSGVATNKVTHDIYVADTGHGDVARFHADGTPMGTFGALSSPTFLAVDNSAAPSQGAVYVVNQETEIAKYSASGLLETTWATGGILSGFGPIAGIAVDQAGALDVLEQGGSTVHIYSPSGVEQTTFTAPRGTRAAGLVVDSEGSLYKIDGDPEVTKFDTSGANLANNLSGTVTAAALGLDTATDDLYVINGGNPAGPAVSVFAVNCGNECQAKEEFGEGELQAPGAIAVDASSGAIYVADAGTDRVDRFGAQVIVPDVTDGEPTEVTPRKAKLNGTVNPDGLPVSECFFEYSVAGSMPEAVPCEGAIPTDDQSHEVAALLTGLEPNTTYSVRLVAGNINGKSSSAGAFTTASVATVQPPTAITATSATLNGTVAPEGEPVTDCVFEYGESESFGLTVPCAEGVPLDEAVHAVHADVGGLSREGQYFFRLVINQPSGESTSLTESFESAGARVSDEAATLIAVDGATLGANINSRGLPVTYRFEYGTTPDYGGQTGAKPFEGNGPVAEAITGLAPGTVYHWRIVLSDPFGEVLGNDHVFQTFSPAIAGAGCPNAQFRLGPASFLPDCRAYERASPADKNGGSVQAFLNSLQAPVKGGAITFFSQAGVPGGVGAQDVPTFLSSRGPSGWTTQGLLPPQALGEGAGVLGLSPNLNYAITQVVRHSNEYGVFERNLVTGADTAVVPFRSGPCDLCFVLAGTSADGSKVFLETEFPLTGETTPGEQNVYVWDRASGDIELVDVDPTDSPMPEGSFAGAYEWELLGQQSRGGAAAQFYTGALNAISEDGDQAVFTERKGAGEAGLTQLYVRTGLLGASPETIEISAYQGGLGGPAMPAAFLGATPDGHYVFFKSQAELTSTANSGVSGESWNLYRYDVPAEKLVDLTPDTARVQENGPGVIGMLGSSLSGDSAYFVARAPLTDVPGPEGAEPAAGEANLYHFDDDANPPLAFVATLENGGLEGGERNDSPDWSPVTERQGQSFTRLARVSGDGQVVVFSSHRPLTGIPNSNHGCNGGGLASEPLEECAEFFRYSALGAALNCLSCGINGALPIGSATLGPAAIHAGETPAQRLAPILPRNLSASGDRFFFQTPDALVARDVNGRSGCSSNLSAGFPCQDVYEWEAPGAGSCTGAVFNGGCINLVSSGESDQAAYFANADDEGVNSFIVTASQLVPVDRDQLYDAYDVIEGGGMASQYESPPARCTSLLSCQGAAATAGPGMPAGSETFVGPGNHRAKKCKKGFVRRHELCVRKKHHTKHHAKRRGAKRGHGHAKAHVQGKTQKSFDKRGQK